MEEKGLLVQLRRILSPDPEVLRQAVSVLFVHGSTELTGLS